MILNGPCIITPRLLPGVRIGESFVSIEYGGKSDGRQEYTVHIDAEGFEYTFDDLRSAVGGGDLREGLVSTLSFLAAAGESYGYTQRTGRQSANSELFPQHVAEWAFAHSDELSMAEWEVEETTDCIKEQ